MKRKSDVDYLVDENGCWIWQLGLTGPGKTQDLKYGQKWDKEKQKQVRAHKWYYEQVKGSVPEGMWLYHLCRVCKCVNPDHLEAVTPRENIMSGDHVQKKYCKNGHARVSENQFVEKSGRTRCRPCVNKWNAENLAKYHETKV